MEARNRSLPDWFTCIRTGQVRLPRFQRFESWDHSVITNLLETVLSGLPAGAALVLAVGDKEQFVSRPVSGAPDLPHQPTEHLLDGQQRLTALWKSFHDSYEDRVYFAHFEGDEDGAPVPKIYGQKRWDFRGSRRPVWVDNPAGVHQRGYIPLRLLRPGELGNEIREWCETAAPENLEESFGIERRITDLRQNVATYNIPFLELLATTPKHVALDVFIKMNTSFVRLTAFDVIVAQFEEQTGESLHDLLAKLHEKVAVLDRYLDPSDLILDVAAMREDRPPTQASYQRLGLTKLFDDWDDLGDGVSWAIAFLEEESVFDGDRLPSTAVIRVLAALHPFLPSDPDDLGNARRLFRKYIWRAFFTGRYESAAATASIQDLRGLRAVLSGEGDAYVPVFDEEQFPLPTVEQLKQARWPRSRDTLARAILAVSIRTGARDLADDAPATREQIGRREYHHLFPVALLEKDGRLQPRDIHRALNCALITWTTNRSISAKEPFEYLMERVSGSDVGEGEIRQRLSSHLIPFDQLSVGGYSRTQDVEERAARVREDYEAFLEMRAESVARAMRELAQGQAPGV